jgi:hypothetical protein
MFACQQPTTLLYLHSKEFTVLACETSERSREPNDQVAKNASNAIFCLAIWPFLRISFRHVISLITSPAWSWKIQSFVQLDVSMEGSQTSSNVYSIGCGAVVLQPPYIEGGALGAWCSLGLIGRLKFLEPAHLTLRCSACSLNCTFREVAEWINGAMSQSESKKEKICSITWQWTQLCMRKYLAARFCLKSRASST